MQPRRPAVGGSRSPKGSARTRGDHALRARTVSPAAVCTATARPPELDAYSAAGRICARSGARDPGLGQLPAAGRDRETYVRAWPTPAKTPLPGVGGAWRAALPASSNRAASDANSSSPIRLTGSSRNRASRSASAVPTRRNSWTGPRTGGNAENMARNTGSPIWSHCSHSRNHASPSRGSCAASRTGR